MLNSLVQASALELAPFGVRVNAVAPGITKTNFRISEVFPKEKNQEYLDDMGDYCLLNRQAIEPKCISNTILFLASDQSSMITGEILPIDNGYILNHDFSFNETDQDKDQ